MHIMQASTSSTVSMKRLMFVIVIVLISRASVESCNWPKNVPHISPLDCLIYGIRITFFGILSMILLAVIKAETATVGISSRFPLR